MSSPANSPTTSSQRDTPPGVNNAPPYTAKSWRRAANMPRASRFSQLMTPDATHKSSLYSEDSSSREPDNDNADRNGSDEEYDFIYGDYGPREIEDSGTYLDRTWGKDVRRWLPASLPYPSVLMSRTALERWPPGVIVALAELAWVSEEDHDEAGDDSSGGDSCGEARRVEALKLVETAVSVRRFLSKTAKFDAGRWVSGVDVDYAIKQMNGGDEGGEDGDVVTVEDDADDEMVVVGEGAGAASGAPQRPATGDEQGSLLRSKIPVVTTEFTWVNNNWEGNLHVERPPSKKRKFDPELGSDGGSVCSQDEVPSGMEFEAFRMQKKVYALRDKIAELKAEVREGSTKLEDEAMTKQDAKRFIADTRSSLTRYLAESERNEDPQKFISDVRNSMTSFVRLTKW